MNQELLILTNLLCNEQYVRKVTPFLKSEYFTEFNYRIIFDELHAYINKYNSLADKNILYIELEKRTDLTDDGFQQVKGIIESIICEEQELPWLLDTTEKWCQERAIYLARMDSIKIADAIPKAILTKTGASAFGRACLNIVLALEKPSDCAA